MDAIKLLAAVVFKLRNEQGHVHLTLADLNAAVVADRTNLRVTPCADGIRLEAIGDVEAKAERRAQEVRRPWPSRARGA